MIADKYRPDIDGLRAVAVLSVLLFHLDVSAFSGGFVGVDVFFVISGYLITGLIKAEYDSTKKFNFFRFYVRRFRRIFPALFVAAILCLIPAFLLFGSTLFSEFFASLIASLTSVSNIYFWSKVSYFDTSAEMKPLLHTWSLSVEEQYYLIAPAFGLIALRAGPIKAPLLIACVGIASLWANIAFPSLRMQYDMPSTIFYLMPFRVFEFAIGALLVWVPRKSEPHARDEILLPVALAMIAIAVFGYSEKMVFPSYYALLPCGGAALAIYSGRAAFAGNLLRNPLAVGIGLISYSLYLVHWPFIVFYRYATDHVLSTAEKLGLFAVSVAAAYLLYRLVEQRFRYSSAPVHFKLYYVPAFAAGIGIFIAAVIWSSGRWTAGYPENVARQLTAERREEITQFTHHLKGQIDRDFPPGRSQRFLVVGDSMAGDFINLLNGSGYIERFDVRSFPMEFPCPPSIPIKMSVLETEIPKSAISCAARLKQFDSALNEGHPTDVILAFKWQNWHLTDLEKGIRYLKSRGVNSLAIVGLKTISIDGQKFLTRNAWRENIQSIYVPPSADAQRINDSLKAISDRTGATFYDPLDLICPKQICDISSAQRDVFYYDDSHLTIDGTSHFAPIFGKAWGKKLFGPLSSEDSQSIEQSTDMTPGRKN